MLFVLGKPEPKSSISSLGFECEPINS
jgi:hypothetical protein